MGVIARIGAAFGRRRRQPAPRDLPAGVKASMVGALIARLTAGMPVWSERDYAKLGREGYQQNPVVARAVDLIAEAVASIELELYRGRGKQRTAVETHPLLDLLQQPNPEQDGVAFVRAAVSHLMISGNCYLERTNDGADIERTELYVHRPDRITVVPAADGMTQGYEYRAGGDVRRFEIDVYRGRRPLLHIKRFHPVDDWYGMSPLDPASWSIDAHNAASAWNRALLENAAMPSGAFVYTGNPDGGGKMSDAQFLALRAELDDMQAAANKGRPMLLDGGVDWKPFSIDPERMQFTEAKNLAAREIAFVLGVPPMLLGIPGDNTYSNYQEANRAFHRSTVIPLAGWLARALTGWFRGQLDEGMHLAIDLDKIPALVSERMDLWKQLDATRFLSLNEKREQLGWEAREGGDDLYVGSGDLPIGEPDLGAVAGGPPPPTDDVPDEDAPPAAGKRRLLAYAGGRRA